MGGGFKYEVQQRWTRWWVAGWCPVRLREPAAIGMKRTSTYRCRPKWLQSTQFWSLAQSNHIAPQARVLLPLGQGCLLGTHPHLQSRPTPHRLATPGVAYRSRTALPAHLGQWKNRRALANRQAPGCGGAGALAWQATGYGRANLGRNAGAAGQASTVCLRRWLPTTQPQRHLPAAHARFGSAQDSWGPEQNSVFTPAHLRHLGASQRCGGHPHPESANGQLGGHDWAALLKVDGDDGCGYAGLIVQQRDDGGRVVTMEW